MLLDVVSQGIATLLCCQARTSCGQPLAVSVPLKTPADQLPDQIAKGLVGDEVAQLLAEPQELEEACPTAALQLDGGCADAMGARSASGSNRISI
jgi:hypothetical protein